MAPKLHTYSRAPGPAPVTSIDSDEMCPVCKTLRYLNRDMRFLISPECYHQMCTTCVDRLFDSGPAQCPYAGCHKTLRKKQFREAFFGDLAIEREVDIRKRVAHVFNRRQEDFETLRDYNDYLEDVETLVFDLVNGSEAERTKAESKLIDWERQHKEEIEAIRRARGDERELRRVMLEQEREEARRRREIMAQEDAEEKVKNAGLMNEVIDALANSTTADPEKEVSKIILKKRGRRDERDAASAAAASSLSAGAEMTNLSIRGLKKRLKHVDRLRAKEMQGPYSPFQGLRLGPSRYPALEDKGVYRDMDLDKYMTMSEFEVPGYSPAEYYRRTLFEAFGGLAVFIGEEEEPDVQQEVKLKVEMEVD